jgi:hypothetical protein
MVMTPVNDQCSTAVTGIATGFALRERRPKPGNFAICRDSAPPPTDGDRVAAGCHPPDPSLTTSSDGGVGRLSP